MVSLGSFTRLLRAGRWKDSALFMISWDMIGMYWSPS